MKSWCGAALMWLGVAGTLVQPATASVENRWETLGAEATVYRIFLVDEQDQDKPVDATSGHALHLEVVKPGEDSLRLLVPGTEDLEAEKSPSLSYSRATETLLIVWEHQSHLFHSSIRVVGYNSERGFFELREFVGNLYYAKQHPKALLTTDVARWRLVSDGDEEPPEHHVSQQLLHVVWREEQGHVFYSALAEGTAGEMANTEVIDLSLLLPELSDSSGGGIEGTLTLTPGKDGQTALVSFIDPVKRTLESVAISTLPIELSMLADAGFDSILDAESSGGSDLVSVSESARSHIVFIGRSLVSSNTTSVLSTEVARSILESEDVLANDGWVAVAEHARSHIVFIGRSLRLDQPEVDNAFHLSLHLSAPTDPSGATEPQPTVNLLMHHLSSMDLPAEAPGDVEIVVSTDGERALIFWPSESGSGLRYTERDRSGWSPIYTLGAQQVGSLANVEALLRSRFRASR